MGVSWTKEQQQVISLRNRNILVSAAAGSGKTAVLVERIISMVTEEKNPVDIDRLLIVTFTKAAAGEMRERIRDAIEKRLEEEPENDHLQKQMSLVHNAQITTIDSFCQYVIRNHFHAIDLDPGYRIADEGELKLLKNDVAEELLEEAYANRTPEFELFAESFATGKSDREITELILRIYEYSTSYPWPKDWMEQCKQAYEINGMEAFVRLPWVESLMRQVRLQIQDMQETVEEAMAVIRSEDGPYMYEEALESDQAMLNELMKSRDYWEFAAAYGSMGRFARLSSKRDEGVSERKKEQVKSLREQIKKSLGSIQEQYFYGDGELLLSHMQGCRGTMRVLLDLAAAFFDKFSEKKREKNLLDFSDLEHLALQILVRKEEGRPVPTDIAKEFSDTFEEILIDEYQDSNLVQEYILTSVSGKWRDQNNIFMVGDVKQSIYRFRLARPELFMEKFGSYSTEDAPNQRIDLHKNFRSREQVLTGVNFIFAQIMADYLGNITYDEKAALYPGARFPDGSADEFRKTELLLVNLDEDADLLEESGESVRELEARAIGRRIREIIGKELVLDKLTGKYRTAEYRDIVILLRTVAGWADTMAVVLGEQGIPTYTGSQTGYFSTVEIQTVLSLLKAIDNPKQDIPMAAVLLSPIAGLDTEGLALIKSAYPDLPYEGACRKYWKEGETAELREQLEAFFLQLDGFRKRVPYTAMHELLWMVLEETGYGDYAAAMPGGEQRIANLNMLVEKAMVYESTSYHGLFNFIRYIENLQKYDVDFGEASVLGEEENTVRIMSIHKSKGLEFPIVFAAGMSKRFNQQDSRSKLVIHPELGIGCDYVDPERRMKVPTLLKKTIQRETVNENLGEELRVLYVAMTRAKEKLILTGTVSQMEKKMKKWAQPILHEKTALSFTTLSGAGTYLDWVMPAVLRHHSAKDLLQEFGIQPNTCHPLYAAGASYEILLWNGGELAAEETARQMQEVLTKEALLCWDTEAVYDKHVRECLNTKLEYVYPFEEGFGIHGKMTVSELKKRSMEADREGTLELYPEQDVIPLIPRFRSGEERKTGAARGTVYHKFLEHLDFTRSGNIREVQDQLLMLQRAGRMTQEEVEMIQAAEIVRLAQSELGLRIQDAQRKGNLCREQQFVIGFEAKELNPEWKTEDLVLVQGIMDAFFYEEGGIVLLDYKTDYVERGCEGELIRKYGTQLEYYARALERMTGCPVKERYLYSFWLQKELSNL